MSVADAGTGLKSDGGAGPGRPGPALAGCGLHEGLDDAQGAQARYKSAEYMILDSEVRSGIDDKEGSGSESDGQSNSSSLGTNSRDSPSPSGRGHGSGAQDDDSNGNDGHSSDDHSNSGHRHGPSSRGRRLGTDDSHSNRRNNNNNDNNDNDDNDNNNNHGNSGYEPRDSNHDNPARHDNDNNDDGHDPGHRAAPTPEESEAAQARLLEVYRNAQDAAIAELRQSDPTHAQQLALLQSVTRGGDLTTPPPSQQGVI
ncbi:hypothetical protein KXV65_004304 [Aspergillus fumigatus]|nr:hypothetical protein KXV65_004304 [Aspergillus fumigatus]KAH2250303.1 hypothetical protein KXW26_003975 [Aspergillus fumigatus]KAH2286082.1 hypothetical protein KXW82_004197 [Aspergillus fumigatus]KAH2643607.1 hypothetical protein KXW90_006735 [Aspergillus fumigatus]KAH2796397.1 hypothetical protein KXV23_005442 [Aspergillus fumigatus]